MRGEGVYQKKEYGLEMKPGTKEFFGLQYSAAQILSEKLQIPLEEALFKYTVFPRRFGLAASGGSVDTSNPRWQTYVQGLKEHPDDPVEYTLAFYRESPSEAPRSPEFVFGCFSFEPPLEDGVVKIHFNNTDTDEKGPLSNEKIEKRKQELTEMFTHIKQTYPQAAIVRGASWLYEREEYRRLFPASYCDSRQPFEQGKRIQGMHYWGQFLDSKREVRPELAQQFLDNLKEVDTDHILDAFPALPNKVEAPMADFYAFYGIA
ncbi:MAG: hypothetical protein WC030_03830 [Candidatus Paceibacterota bacterium]